MGALFGRSMPIPSVDGRDLAESGGVIWAYCDSKLVFEEVNEGVRGCSVSGRGGTRSSPSSIGELVSIGDRARLKASILGRDGSSWPRSPP